MAGEIQAPLAAQLDARYGAAGRAGRHRPSGSHSPFRAQPNYAILNSAFAALLLAASGATQATIINARSPSLADVRAAIASAVNGDTVMVPAGTASWTSTLLITKGITLIGQTTTDSVAGTAADNTIIQDNLPRPPSQPMIRLSTVLGKSYRISGITFAPGTVTATNYNGAVIFNGNSQSVRIDHCHFRPMPAQGVYVEVAGVVGVADHNVMELPNGTGCFHFTADAWPYPSGLAGDWGDGSWASPTNFGSSQFFFVEDNYLANVSSPFYQLGGNTDDSRGGRWVFRYNHCYDIEIQTHGTESGRYRGGRAREIYNNDFHYAHAHPFGGIRSGVTISHDNTFDGVRPTAGLVLESYRAFQTNDPASFGSGTGDNPWDVGDPHGLYDSGTVSSGSRTALVETTKNWQVNRWAGFTAKRLSDGKLSFIISNTANALTLGFTSGGYGGGCPIWASGNQYQIRKALILLDQPGRGQGDPITGTTPINSTTRRRTRPQQALEPTYSWNDIYTPTNTHVNLKCGSGNLYLQQEGRDFYNNTPMPGYTPYVYPHPLTTSWPPPPSIPSAITSSQSYLNKRNEKTAKKVKRWKWGKAKENSANETAERLAPDQPSK
jgi:hypothetical protein